SYTFKVRAHNTSGRYSVWSASSNAVTPFAYPTITKELAPGMPADAVFARGQVVRWRIKIANSDTVAWTISSLTDALAPTQLPTTTVEVLKSVVGGVQNLLCSLTSECSILNNTLTIVPGVLQPNQTINYDVSTVAAGLSGVCSYVNNWASMVASRSGVPPATLVSNLPAVTVCDSGLGMEPWWSYVSRPTGPSESVSVNMANFNAVVQATDSTPTQAHGHLALNLRRTYNSMDTQLLTLPGSIGANWRLSVGSAGDLSGLGLTPDGLQVPSLQSALNAVLFPTSVTMTDRDGTRHLFTAKATFADLLRINVNLQSPTGPLADVLPRILKIVPVPGGDSNPANYTICVEQTFNSPPGVHLSLFRYIQVQALGSTACNAGTVNSPTSAVLGFVAIRPDRLRTEFSADGKLLSMTDGAGVELRYAYDGGALPLLGPLLPPLGPLPVNPLGRLVAVYERSSTCQPPGSNFWAPPANLTACRAIGFQWPSAADPGSPVRWSVKVTDPAGRLTTYRLDADPLLPLAQGLLPNRASHLMEVVEEAQPLSGVAAVTPTVLRTAYEYGSDCPGSNAAPNQLCSITDPRGAVTLFTYYGTVVPAPLLSLTDRRGSTVTFTAYPQFGYAFTAAIEGSHASRFVYNKDASGFVDGTGRMREIDEGPISALPPGTTQWARQTLFGWDSPTSSCRYPDRVFDNNLCSVVRKKSPTGGEVGTVADGDWFQFFSYNESGQVTGDARVARSPYQPDQVTLTTTNGYHNQFFQADGSVVARDDTVQGSGLVSFAPFGTSGTGSRIDAATLFFLSDPIQSLPPRGNDPANAATYPSYMTSMVRDVPAGTTVV
ncbi:MAG: hypothetical protein ACRD0U_13790, partial [Acidimicrobiales bacterium]